MLVVVVVVVVVILVAERPRHGAGVRDATHQQERNPRLHAE